MPPGTAARLGTRQGVGSRAGVGTRQGQAPLGVGAHTEISVTDRPLTMAGLSGMKTGSLGPKRQIYDKTFYMQELRTRCTQLHEEVGRLNKEVEEIRQDNQLYASLDKRYDTLVKTVRSLEGDLADHNLATDKQRTDTQPEEVHQMYLMMKQQNDQQRSDVDQIFLEKRSHEEEIERMQEEIVSLTRAAESRLNELHPDQQREYVALRDEHGQLGHDIAEGREELDQVGQRLAMLQGHLQSDPLRGRVQQLLSLRSELEETLGVLESEARQCDLSIPEQREILLSKVKTDNAEIVQAEKVVSDLKLEKERLKARIEEVITDSQEHRDEAEKQKYEILFTKDQEMSQFMDSFDDLKKAEEGKLKEKQDNILVLLENITKSVARQGGIDLNEMEDELDFKRGQLQNSETTLNRLEADLAKRQGELEKIETLDTKISQELQQVENKMKQYQEEIETKFEHVATMKSDGNDRVKSLEVRKKYMEGRKSALQQQAGFLKLRHQSKKQQLSEDAVVSSLDAQEQKIGQFGQNLYALNAFITQKSLEVDFQYEQTVCLDRASELNRMLLERKPLGQGM